MMQDTPPTTTVEPLQPRPRSLARHRNNAALILIVAGITAALWPSFAPKVWNAMTASMPEELPQQHLLRQSLTDGNLKYLSDHYQRASFPRSGSRHSDGLLLVPSLDKVMVGENVQVLPSAASWGDYTSLDVHIDHNETFVAIPVQVPGCSVIRHAKSSFQGKLRRTADVTFWVRVTHEGLLDANAFVQISEDTLAAICPLEGGIRAVPVPLLSNVSLRAAHTDDVQCSAGNVAATREALGVPRMAKHVGVFWTTLHDLLRRKPYIRKMIENAKRYPFHVDLYIHINNVDPGDERGAELRRSDAMFHLKDLWTDSQHDVAPTGDAATDFVFQRMIQSPTKHPRIFVVSHPVRESGLLFLFKPRQQILHQFHLYDVVVFTEDDMDIRPQNVEYYCRYKNAARDLGRYLAFFRVEYGKVTKSNPTGKILPDLLISARHGSTRAQPVYVQNELFAQNAMVVYHAFWFADRKDLAAMIAGAQYFPDTSRTQGGLREEASCLHGSMVAAHYRNPPIFPVHPTTHMLHPMSEVHHMSNAYIRRGRAPYQTAVHVQFDTRTV